ncbi:MAG: hypothetical protein U0P81_08365 [Holophagaceae bacterium]
MLKLAVVGAQTLLGRELVGALEPQECTVLPLATGPLSKDDEEGDLVVFAPEPALLEGLDVAILVDTPQDPELLAAFPGRVLDLRAEADPRTAGDPMPLGGTWPPTVLRYRGRAALDQVLALLPRLVSGIADLGGTHLRSVAHLGDRGIDALVAQSHAVMHGEDPDTESLGHRLAFELVPQPPRGSLIEVRTPTFHGDLLILTLRAAEGQSLARLEAPEGVKWVDAPPSSRDVAVSSELLAHFAPGAEGRTALLTLGFDPILWGVLRPVLRLLGL